MNEVNESFNSEELLKDILAVLKKHGLPVQTVAVDISMFDEDFEGVIPQLKTYKPGILHRPMTIEGVEMLFEAKRRIPFRDLAGWLEKRIVPTIEKFEEVIKDAYPQYTSVFTVKQSDGTAVWPDTDYFGLTIDLRFSDAEDAQYKNNNNLQLSIHLVQRGSTEYPQIDAWVAWLVDYERFMDGYTWGVDTIYRQSFSQEETLWGMFDTLENTLPTLFSEFQRVIEDRSRK
jgi:hypothetical protein